MYRKTSPLVRLVSSIVAVVFSLGALLAGAPPHAQAATATTLFRAEFDSAPVGAVSGPLTVETGTVVPQGSVAIAAASSGRALALNSAAGPATALMQWSNFPGALPISTTQELSLRISASFTTSITGTGSISGTAGASFGLLSGATFVELFSFGANGALTRGGAPIGLSYVPSDTVRLDSQITLLGNGGLMRVTLIDSKGFKSISLPLPAGITAATLNQLRLQAPAGSGVTTADHVNVRIQATSDEEPPAIIIIHDGDIEHEIENVHGIIFVNIKITIVNTGGEAHGTFLILNLDDFAGLFDLADVSFLTGVGFVKELDEHHVMIGLGNNNVLDGGGKLQLKLKFKVKHGGAEIKLNAHFRLAFNDSDGDHELIIPPVLIVVPVVVVPVVVVPVVVVQRLPLTVIDVRFLHTWNGMGGLDIFGLPLTEPITQSNGIVIQYFERARLEWHPELHGTPYEVLLGLLAVELGHTTTPTSTTVPTSTVDVPWYFPATGHLIARPFRGFWSTRGGLAIFGLPIGEAVMENGLLVQYFERARMELHPELAGTRYEVQLGHLGVQALEATQTH